MKNGVSWYVIRSPHSGLTQGLVAWLCLEQSELESNSSVCGEDTGDRGEEIRGEKRGEEEGERERLREREREREGGERER